MSKAILSLLAVTLVCVAGTSALASDGTIASSTLDSMGLAGLTVMTDSQALEVRGMGYQGSMNSYRNRRHDHKKKQEAKKPWASAEGKSWASVELDGYKEEAQAGTRNEYKAAGNYEAGGSNFSEATLSKTDVEIIGYSDGTFSSKTNVRTIHVEAGGYSNAKAF
jgi:hypothetical protein